MKIILEMEPKSFQLKNYGKIQKLLSKSEVQSIIHRLGIFYYLTYYYYFVFSYHEADSLQKTNLLISYIYPAFNKELVDKLIADKPNLTVFALDC